MYTLASRRNRCVANQNILPSATTARLQIQRQLQTAGALQVSNQVCATGPIWLSGTSGGFEYNPELKRLLIAVIFEPFCT
jgi:hypothetical protein